MTQIRNLFVRSLYRQPMRALVFADRAPRARIADLVASTQPDLILTLGDLSNGDLMGLERVELPKFGVHGNHDADYFPSIGIVDLHLRVVEFAGLRLGGFEGSPRYKAGPYQYTQQESLVLLETLPAVDVLVCHAPPAGVNDHPGSPTHEGFEGLARYVMRHRPKLLLHGHTYPDESEVVSRVDTTEVRYVYGWAVVELP
jgi:predicted phosphodiesterase